MKKTQQGIIRMLTILGFIQFGVHMKAQVSCNLESADSILTNISSISCGGQCTPLKYIPGSNDSILYVRLYYHFILPAANTGNYKNVSSTDVAGMTNFLNYIYDSLWTPQLKFHPTPQAIKPKIKFVVYNWQKHIDPNAWLLPNPYPQSGHLDTAYYDPYRDPNAINIIFNRVNGYANPHSNGIPSTMIGLLKSANDTAAFNWMDWTYTFAHEVGHCLGLEHTDSVYHYTSWQSTFPSSTCFTRDYVIEGNGVYGNYGSCVDTDTLHSNNLMGQHYDCNKYLSPNQIAICRYNLLNYPPLFKTIANASEFNNSTTELFVNTSYDTTIYSNITWNHDRFSRGNVIVKSGATLIIKTCSQTFRGNAKIIVEPGARLYVVDKELKSYSCLPWGGVEVWGNKAYGQDTVNQGKMNIKGGFSAAITNAKYGITTGKRFSNSTIDFSKTGGIIEANYVQFNNNSMDIDFQPYYSTAAWFMISNKSRISNCTFSGDRSKNGTIKSVCINLNGIYGVNLIGNDFRSGYGNSDVNVINEQAVATGIYALNSHFVAKGVNYFRNFHHGIVVQNPTNSTWPAVIDHNAFVNNVENGIVLLNTIGSKVTNNSFNTFNNTMQYFPCTGLYLYESTNYKVEDNLFQGNNSVTYDNQVGIYVRNSGPYSNNIYNNTFTNLQQGIFALGYNWDPTSGVGLKMNCNDFSASTYNIGVMDVPYVTYGVDWTGVDRTQGLATSPFHSDRVRNTYGVTNCGAAALENKFYMHAFNNSITNYFYINSHGNFPASQFKPSPQIYQSCSDTSEVVVLSAASNPAGAKSTYCPDNSPFLSMTKSQLYGGISLMVDSTTNLETLINTRIDKGRTADFLALIADIYLDPDDLKDSLLSVGAYLSDTVMKAYFAKDGVRLNHIKQVQALNGPVSPMVWRVINDLTMSDGLRDSMATVQALNSMSGANDLKARNTYYNHNLQDMYFEKLDRFLNDSANNMIDSAIVFLGEGKIPNSDLMLTDLYHSIGDAYNADAQLSVIEAKGGIYEDWVWLKSNSWYAYADPEQMRSLSEDYDAQSQIYTYAYSGNSILEGMARTLLYTVWGVYIPEEKPVPGLGGGGGLRSVGAENNKVINLANSVKLYPNPVMDVLNIEMQNNDATNLIISNISGQLLIKHDLITENRSIDMHSLPNGVYLVSIYNNKSLITTKKIVVVK